MTYIDYLNEFNRWIENNHLTLPAQVLYFRLLNVFNRAGWPEWVPVDTIRLQVMTNGLSKPSAYRARDELVKAGFIRYQQGKKGARAAIPYRNNQILVLILYRKRYINLYSFLYRILYKKLYPYIRLRLRQKKRLLRSQKEKCLFLPRWTR